MSPLPVIDNTFRLTWDFQSVSGMQPAIVQHYRTATADVPALGASIWASVVDHLFDPMYEGFEPTSISIIPLDGISATTIVPRPSGVTANLCQGDGDIIPEMSYVLSLRTTQRGPRGRGRSYIGPITEGTQQGGKTAGTAGLAVLEAWQDFLENLQGVDPAIGLAVASYVHEEAIPISSFTVGNDIGFQKRRLLQTRAG